MNESVDVVETTAAAKAGRVKDWNNPRRSTTISGRRHLSHLCVSYPSSPSVFPLSSTYSSTLNASSAPGQRGGRLATRNRRRALLVRALAGERDAAARRRDGQGRRLAHLQCGEDYRGRGGYRRAGRDAGAACASRCSLFVMSGWVSGS